MQPSGQWALRLPSQSSTQAIRYAVNPVQSTRYFFSCYSLLYTPSKDPEKLEAHRKYQREYRFRRRREDEAYRERELVRNHRYIEKRRADPAGNDALCKHRNIYRSQRYASDKEFRERMRFLSWITRSYRGIREGLVWKTHVLVLYGEKVKHSCVGCGYPPQGGLRFCKPSNH
jgi:hypothetical protein